MISVTIAINGQTIVHRVAVNILPSGTPDNLTHTYKSDDGATIKHKRDLGAVALAIKMLENVKEVL